MGAGGAKIWIMAVFVGGTMEHDVRFAWPAIFSIVKWRRKKWVERRNDASFSQLEFLKTQASSYWRLKFAFDSFFHA